MTKKERKKRERQMNKISKTTDNEVRTGMIILLVILVIFGAFYLITAYVKGEIFKKDTPKVEEEVMIQYSEILAGTTFNQTSSEYYVLFVGNKHNKLGYLETLVNKYDTKKDALNFYFVDTENSFNTGYLTDDVSYVPTGIEDLKVTSLALLKVKDKKVDTYITGEDKIVEYLVNLTK